MHEVRFGLPVEDCFDGVRHQAYYAMPFRGGTLLRREKNSALSAFDDAFAGAFHPFNLWHMRRILNKELLRKDIQGVLLWKRGKKEDTIVGFSYFEPVSRAKVSSGERIMSFLGRFKYSPIEPDAKIANVVFTAIKKADQGKGGWTKMMDMLDQLIAVGNFDYVTRTARFANGYDDKIRGRYKDQIVCEGLTRERDLMYFRCRAKPLKA